MMNWSMIILMSDKNTKKKRYWRANLNSKEFDMLVVFPNIKIAINFYENILKNLKKER